MKFIRKHGRVIPIKGKGEQPAKQSKPRKPLVLRAGVGSTALTGFAIGAMAGSLMKKPLHKSALVGAAIGGVLGSIGFTKRAKGESKKQLAKRAGKAKIKWW